MEIFILNRTSTYNNNQISDLVSKIQNSEALKQFCIDWSLEIPKLNYLRIGWPLPSGKPYMNIIENYSHRKSHHTVQKNIPIANIFCSSKVSDLSFIFTHELFELLINPYMTETFTFQNQVYLKEVSDPVTKNYFIENDLKISDWILPSWFQEGFIGKTNHLNTLEGSFELSPGGYVQKPQY
jgi:hypothetical protein